MLFGEHFGRRHQHACRAPSSAPNMAATRPGSSRADVTLQEPMHRQWSRHVAGDVAEHAPLRIGEGESVPARKRRTSVSSR